MSVEGKVGGRDACRTERGATPPSHCTRRDRRVLHRVHRARRLTNACSGRGPLRCCAASALPFRVAGHTAEARAISQRATPAAERRQICSPGQGAKRRSPGFMSVEGKVGGRDACRTERGATPPSLCTRRDRPVLHRVHRARRLTNACSGRGPLRCYLASALPFRVARATPLKRGSVRRRPKRR
jgi:hypothetical protein